MLCEVRSNPLYTKPIWTIGLKKIDVQLDEQY